MKRFLIFLSLFWVLPAAAWTHLSSNLYGWNTKSLTFYLNPTNCSLPEATVRTIITNALNAWNGIPGTDLRLSLSATSSSQGEAELEAGTATDNPLIICVTSLDDADVIPGALAYSGVDSAGHMNYGGIILNSQPGAGAEISQIEQGTLELILAHEVGHALGLGHSGDPQALMYYSVGGKTAPIITQDDQDGMMHLYPRSELSDRVMGCNAVHDVSGRPAPVGSLLVWAAIWLGTFGLGRVYRRSQT